MARKKEIEKKNSKRKSGFKVFVFVLVAFFLIGGVGGFFTFKYLTKDDKFELIGEKQITLTVGEEYVEQGAVVTSFGKDESGQIEIESNLDTLTAGSYYIKYTAKDFRFNGKVRYRYIEVVEVTP